MNKQKFVEYLRAPESLDEQQFDEFKQLLVDHPYFSIAKSIAARAAKNLNDDHKGDLISTAAIYATDRKRLKKYINGDLIFLTDKPKVSESEPKAPKTPQSEDPKFETRTAQSSADEIRDLTPPSPSEVDQILDELEHDMEELRKSRMHFAEIQSQLDTVEALKSEPKPEKEKPEPKVESTKTTKTEEKVEPTSTEEEKSENLGNLMIDLEALKKEFEQEETKEESKIEDKKSESKEKTQTEVSKAEVPEEDDDEEEISTPPPSPPRSKNIVTNMSEAEENDDNEPGYFDKGPEPEPEKPKPAPRKKKPARADRDSRMKVKRSELDQFMGLKSIPKPKAKEETPEEAKKEQEKEAEKKQPAAKRPAKKTVAKKTQEKPATSLKKKAAKKEEPKPEIKTKAAPKKKTTAKKETTKATEEKATKSTTTARASSKKTAAKKKTESKKESTLKKTSPKKESSPSTQEDPGSDPVTRATRKALLDFGKAEGLSMSVSRASSSKRRRKSKGKSEEGGPAKKDDDDSGGADSIIDKFIEENPSISRKATSPSKEDLSEKSTSWQDDVASEYLAEIYLKQGNKQRAKKIYQALSLKFPEKKSYFAGLIQKLEE